MNFQWFSDIDRCGAKIVRVGGAGCMPASSTVARRSLKNGQIFVLKAKRGFRFFLLTSMFVDTI